MASKGMPVEAEDLNTDLLSAPSLLEVQMDAGHTEEEILQAMFNEYTARIEGMTCKVTQNVKIALTRGITGGPWTMDQKRSLTAAVMRLGDAAGRKPTGRRTNQTCLHFENFVTMLEWALM